MRLEILKKDNLMKLIMKFLLLSIFSINAFANSVKNSLPNLLDPQVQIYESLPSAHEKIMHAPAKSWFKSYVPGNWFNVAKYAVGAGALSYGAIFSYLLYASYKLNDAQSWGSWHNHISLADLKAQEQITYQELLLAMGEKYKKELPARSFINDIESELSTVRNYLALSSWLTYLKIVAIFPAQEKLMVTAQDKLERLEYIQNLILGFAESK